MTKLIYSSEKVTRFIVLTLVTLLPLSWVNIGVGSFYRYLMIASFLVFLLTNGFRIPIYKRNKKYLSLWVLLLGYEAISLFWSTNFASASNNRAASVLMLFVVMIVSNYPSSRENLIYIEKAWVLAGLLSVAVFLFGGRTIIGSTILSSRYSLVILGTITDPNEFGCLFVITMPMTYLLLSKQDRLFWKLTGWVFIFLEFYVVLMTGSRGALYASVISLVLSIGLARKLSVRSMILTTLIISTILFIAVRFLLPLIPSLTLARVSFDAVLRDGGSGRMDIWTSGLSNWSHGGILRILFGYGDMGVSGFNPRGVTTTMHNQIIQTLVNYGVVGLLFYIMLMFEAFISLRKLDKGLVGIFFGMLFASLTITMKMVYKPLWIFLMIGFLREDINQIIKSKNNTRNLNYR